MAVMVEIGGAEETASSAMEVGGDAEETGGGAEETSDSVEAEESKHAITDTRLIGLQILPGISHNTYG
jgi:hypothetical protein